MMRRSLFQMGLLVFGLALIGAQAGNGVVYEAPHYRTVEMPKSQEVSWGGPNRGVRNPCGQQNCGQSGCHYCPSPATKLTRGITNVITGPLELPKHLITGAFNCNVKPLDGLGVGIVRGTSRAIERVGIGFWEVATFPFPDFDPLLCPEYISLEPCMNNWRMGNYCEMPCGVGYNPCHGAGSFMGVRNQPPQQHRQPAPQQRTKEMERPAPAFEQQLQSQAPPQTNTATPGSGRPSGSISYPDDYLK